MPIWASETGRSKSRTPLCLAPAVPRKASAARQWFACKRLEDSARRDFGDGIRSNSADAPVPDTSMLGASRTERSRRRWPPFTAGTPRRRDDRSRSTISDSIVAFTRVVYSICSHG